MDKLMELGKLPPQACDFETAVIGQALLEKSAASMMVELMTGEMFYKESNGKIFSAIKSLYDKSEPVDILTVTKQLRKEGNLDIVGGAVHVSQLTNKVSGTSNLETHIRVVIQKYILRQVISISQELSNLAYMEETDVFDVAAHFEKRMSDVMSSSVKTSYKEMKKLSSDMMIEVGNRANSVDYTHGVASSIKSVQDKIGSYGKTDMIILAGRPGMGKSAFMVTEARNAAKRGIPVAIFSLEMSAMQLTYRIASQETDIDLEILMKKQLDEGRLTHLHKNMGKVENLPIYIDDTGGLSIFDFKARLRRLVTRYGVGLVILDYLQLMTTGNDNGRGNREQEVSLISRTIKAMAKELDVPIIALSQLSRQVESRSDKRPLLSDLRESGSLEQDADVVGFLYRPEYYGINENDEGESTQNYGELLIAKNRNGKLGIAKMKFTGYTTMYSDQDGEYRPSPIKPNINFTEPKKSDEDAPF